MPDGTKSSYEKGWFSHCNIRSLNQVVTAWEDFKSQYYMQDVEMRLYSCLLG